MDHSLLLQLILELATYGYLLSSNWRSRAGGRSIPELFISFQNAQARWEAFEFTDKRRILTEGTATFFRDGIIGVITDEQILQLYRISDLSSTSEVDFPWAEHQLESSDPVSCWDESQDLWILASSPTK